jgi:hypothetical protein
MLIQEQKSADLPVPVDLGTARNIVLTILTDAIATTIPVRN